MANFDAAAGVSDVELNSLLAEYFSVAPADNDPFKGSVTQDVTGIGSVTLTWNIGAAPTLAFGPPSLQVWNAALNSGGVTNGTSGTALPTMPMVQLTIPTLTASYTIDSGSPVGGTTSNVVVYATLGFAPGAIAITIVAVTIDESGFSLWDKAIFNLVLLPQIFAAVGKILQVINVPTISWQGVSLNPLQFQIVGTQLIAAATLSTGGALDVSGVTWPTDNLFILSSNALINAALAAGVAQFQGHQFSDSGTWKDLATWSYSGALTSLTVTVGQVDPLTIDAGIVVSLNVTGGLTPAGMALAVVGCALGGGLLAAAL